MQDILQVKMLLHVSARVFIAVIYLQVIHVIAAQLPASDLSSVAPTVVLDEGTFVGVTDGVTKRFLGIPFAKPPYVLRFTYFPFIGNTNMVCVPA